mmetsp:Transcript_85890/g.221084  ORF Transcript_85890/g.221084 Transcript_85890/m.221084 type:complete len:247 (-) Transcript_85890:72-812(-)
MVVNDLVATHGAALVRDHEGAQAWGTPVCGVRPDGARHELGQIVLGEVNVCRVLVLQPGNSQDLVGRQEEVVVQWQSGEHPTDALKPKRLCYPVHAIRIGVLVRKRHLALHLLGRLIDALQDSAAALVVVLVLEVVAIHPTHSLHRVLQQGSLPVADEVLNFGHIDDREGVNVAVRLLLDRDRRRYLDHAALRHPPRDVPLRTRQGGHIVPSMTQKSVKGFEFGVDLLAVPSQRLRRRVRRLAAAR